jgi:hypothetical protein
MPAVSGPESPEIAAVRKSEAGRAIQKMKPFNSPKNSGPKKRNLARRTPSRTSRRIGAMISIVCMG